MDAKTARLIQSPEALLVLGEISFSGTLRVARLVVGSPPVVNVKRKAKKSVPARRDR